MAEYAAVSKRYERPFAAAMLNDPAFRLMVVSGTRFADLAATLTPIGPAQSAKRSSKAETPFWSNWWCGLDSKCRCRGPSGGIETDIFLLFATPSGQQVALHVEMKAPQDSLKPDQAESYPRRAACWVNPQTRRPTVPPHDDAMTLLICPAKDRSDPMTRHFDKVMTREQIRPHLTDYPR